MSTTPEQQPTDDDRATPAADDATAPAAAAESAPTTGDTSAEEPTSTTEDLPAADPAPAHDDALAAGAASTTGTPARGAAHVQSRRAPVAPEPIEDEDLPRPDTAPTTALPALDDPLTGPLPEPVATTTGESAAVRRTSFRTDYDVPGTAAPDRFSATPPPAPAPVSPPYGTDLPGTGPADDQVPPGDATVPVPEATPAPFPVTPAPVTEQQPRRVREPRRGGIGRLLLGLLIGLVAGAAGLWLVLFGQSRILGVQAPGWDASYDPLGVVLVTVGVLVLVALVGFGAWSTAAPLTAGLLSTVIGVVYLYVPATTHADTVSWLATDHTLGSVERTVVAATSGTLFVTGALLLATGLTFAAMNRRRVPRA
ncbi:hypothetical protein [Cellulomonas sp. RIT-PI-Y]|uniref:hypothetical protein n=1 Tax=Cellulomonas sp. RIT-PI-Y TaxID=3035297 RepID=UPI0021D92905|nr:hypothetical protein [Cellulomonas sp. RIT-PI-Y]